MKISRAISTAAIFIISSNFSLADEKEYPNVYPFTPYSIEKIHSNVKRMAEDQNALINIFEMHKLGLLEKGATKTLPWSSTFWPLNKGGIADPYRDEATVLGDIIRPTKTFSWTRNYKSLKKRHKKVLPKVYSLSEEELALLAPSEKYDLILGDTSFDLTKRQVDYMNRWGSNKKHSDLSRVDKVGGKSIDMIKVALDPQNNWKFYDGTPMDSYEKAAKYAVDKVGGIADQYAYKKAKEHGFDRFEEFLQEGIKVALKTQKNFVLKKQNSFMALWEGICNGWSTAAGILPRPLHAFDIKLPNGKKLKFYPSDVKALLSQLWFNSDIQNGRNEAQNTGGVLSQGLRCNSKSPAVDEWGRYYDDKPDLHANTGIIEPRCVGVHPAIWHMSLVNIIGKQQRSFVVERKIKAAVDNHPMSDYKMEFFNPNTGDYGDLYRSSVRINDEDQFRAFRNPKATHIVGVKTTMAYMNWIRPHRQDVETEEEDYKNRKEIEMLYDLEMDSKGNILGGQWRAVETGKSFLNLGADRTQPDFFWVITKNWKETGYFDDKKNLPEWTDTSSVPPKEWLNAAKKSHAFIYNKNPRTGWYEKCEIRNKKKRKETLRVPCELRENKPLPLTNVVNKLLELSRK